MIDLRKHRDPRFSLPAVRVKSDHPDHDQGFFVINESDFDPEKHELWEEDQPDAGKAGQPNAAIEHGITVAEATEATEAKRAYAAKAAEPAKPSARESQMHLGSRKG
jgi:hypothetical protein